MKKPTLQDLIRLQQHSQLLKDYANDLANQLIIEFDINEGHKIARFLKVSQGLDNYTAVRYWTEKWLKAQYPLIDDASVNEDLKYDDGLYPQLKHQFLKAFSQYSRGVTTPNIKSLALYALSKRIAYAKT